MHYLIHFILGLFMAYIGLLPPGMINMTTVRTTLENGRQKALLFAFGASIIVLLQASIALIFANYFNENPNVIERLSLAGGIVFMMLSIFFFYQGRKGFKGTGTDKVGGFFVSGMLLSSINMLSIPFYLGISTFLSLKGYITLSQPYIGFFVAGASIGAFLLFVSYSFFAEVIKIKAQFIARNINFILSGLFFVLGLITIYNSLS